MHIRMYRLWLVLAIACMHGNVRAQCIPIDSMDVAVRQDFNSLASSGTSNALTLPGWHLREVGNSERVDGLYAADSGASAVGDTLSLGHRGGADRALGSLRNPGLPFVNPTFGACYVNNTGMPIQGLDIGYTGEQWRTAGEGGVDSLRFEYSLDAQSLSTGSWTRASNLDYTNYMRSADGPTDGDDTRFRAPRDGFIENMVWAPGAMFWIRWTDVAHSSGESALAVDDLAVIARGPDGGGLPGISISDVRITEGLGTKRLLFFVRLDRAARAGGVSFEFMTTDGSATAGTDYRSKTGSGFIGQGENFAVVMVDIEGGTSQEPRETFFLDLWNIVGATAQTLRGVATIHDDDMSRVAIHDVQGEGGISPMLGEWVTVRGVVTAVKSNGIFVEASASEHDADSATSEAIFVSTGVPVPPVEPGTGVFATGTVQEYVPASDPDQLPLTQLGGAVEVVDIGAPLALAPAVVLDTVLASAQGPIDQLERFEGMRVTAPSFTVVGPTGESVSEADALGSSDGIFQVVVTGIPRPFREPGIRAPDLPPSGSIPPIPRWDANPEVLTVNSGNLLWPGVDVAADVQVANLAGPLDYTGRRYTILAARTDLITITAAAAPAPARLPTPDEFTIASYNVERFFDTADDPASDDPVLAPQAFAAQLNKASLAVRDYLHTPDVVGLVGIENFVALQAIADTVSTDSVAAGQVDPNYAAYLYEGNDVDGIDVGFLVKTGEIASGSPRVDVESVIQLGADTTWIDPAGGTSLLNDRPPLQLDATVHFEDGRSFPLTAIVVHQRSLAGVGAHDIDGERTRAKRQRQAEFLATEIQAMQSEDPQRHVTVLGDFGAFAFNDGYVDGMGVLTGTPSPDEQTVVPGDGIDLVDPDLRNLDDEVREDQRYSSVIDGNVASLDHLLVNSALEQAAAGVDMGYARINADFPDMARYDAGSPSRLSGRDPLMLYVRLDALEFADLSTVSTVGDAAVLPGEALTFTVVVANHGPDPASFPGIGFALDIAAADLAVSPPDGWSCDAAMVVGDTTSIACTTAVLVIDASATFSVSATAPASATGETVTLTALTTSQTQDPSAENDSDTASVSVMEQADLHASIAGPSTISRGATSGWIVGVDNFGPSPALLAEVEVEVTVPASAVGMDVPDGWTCQRSLRGIFRAVCTADTALPVLLPVPFFLAVSAQGKLFPPRFDVRVAVAAGTDDDDSANNSDAMTVRLVRP